MTVLAITLCLTKRCIKYQYIANVRMFIINCAAADQIYIEQVNLNKARSLVCDSTCLRIW